MDLHYDPIFNFNLGEENSDTGDIKLYTDHRFPMPSLITINSTLYPMG